MLADVSGVLRPRGACSVAVPEISGLAWHARRGTLFAVGDDAGAAFELTRRGDGFEAREIALHKGTRYDLEGIAVAPDSDTLLVVAEKRRKVLRYDLDGALLESITLPIRGRKANAGPEGLTVDPSSGRVFAVNERKPRRVIELDPALDTLVERPLDAFADLSGVCAHDGALWIVSDASAAVGRFEASGDGWQLRERWALPSRGAEGVAIAEGLLFIAFDHGRDSDRPNLAWFQRPG